MYTLRQDLDLSESGVSNDGSPRWLLQDVINNRYYKLGKDEVSLLAFLRDMHLDFQKIDDSVNQLLIKFEKTWTAQRIREFLLFLKQNNLLVGSSLEARSALLKQREHLQPGPFKKLLRNYLFLRFHLLNPNSLLDKVLPHISFIFAPVFWWLIGINAAIGLYLTARQWDFFLSSFINYLNFQGVVIAGIAIALAKILHEFGHAIVARKFGCSVNSMGFALLIFWPVLFTDTTDSWRLKNPKQRALIGSAGVLVELVIASLCLTAWSFVDEGSLKSALFVLATTTWILTLAINLNPLMRFDGYFVLSDLLDIENLQGRSFALARWKLREWMFGFGLEAPEKERFDLICFAFATWVYRFLLYLGIALIIYGYFFKLLGLALVSLQLFTSLAKPLFMEFKFWWENRGSARFLPNTFFSFGLLFCVFLWLVFPAQKNLSLPAYTRSAESAVLFAPYAGRLISLVESDRSQTNQGEILAKLHFPEVEYEKSQVEKEIELLEAQLASTGVRGGQLTPRASLVAQLRSAKEQLEELSARLDSTEVLAPFDGTVRSINPELLPGQWVAAGEKLFTLINPTEQEIVAYVGEEYVADFVPGQGGRFYSDGGQQEPFEVTLVSKERFPVEDIDELYVASTFDGPLSVRDSQSGNLTPLISTYRLYFSAEQEAIERIVRGSIAIEAEAVSPLSRIINNILTVWRRESSF